MASFNAFDLLGDSENDDPSQITGALPAHAGATVSTTKADKPSKAGEFFSSCACACASACCDGARAELSFALPAGSQSVSWLYMPRP
jgi:hypothetical protein